MMRQYTLVFMQQRMGVSGLTRVEGEAGIASFAAADETAAVAYVTAHCLDRLRQCVRAELSSMRIVIDPGNAGTRFVDDSHANPQFQDTYLKYNSRTQGIDLDFESTRTALITDMNLLRTPNPRTSNVTG